MNSIFQRRSVRTYLEKPVEPEKMETLLRAAMQAPSAGNQQASEFLVVQDAAALRQLSRMSPYAGLLAKAPAAIVLLGNAQRMKFSENWEQDLGAAAENLLLEAAELGLGAVWLGVHPLSERIDAVKRSFHCLKGCGRLLSSPSAIPKRKTQIILLTGGTRSACIMRNCNKKRLLGAECPGLLALKNPLQ
jgi:nitroreductase